MILRRLELYGFKSFADRQVFTFAPGLTAIIGPNGCGKSNIVDAFKWILGEQAPSSLRSKGMAEVLHVDREGREAVPYAEGSLTFDNGDGRLPVDAAEVVVARRLHRDGHSEYFVNHRPVRLRDLRDLFLGTGIGTRSYFVLEQGRITDIIRRSPLERRILFEEAAGIGRYHQRRREAERKLERVEENLRRLQDVVAEVSRQVRSLRIQAGRARSYHETAAALKAVRLRAGAERRRRLETELAQVREDLQAVGAAAGRLEEELAAVEDRIRTATARREAAHAARQRYETRLEECRAAAGRARENAAAHRERSVRLGREAARLARELDVLGATVARRRRELTATRGEAEAARRRLGVLAGLRWEKEQEEAAAEEALAAAERAREEHARRAYAAERELAAARNRAGALAAARAAVEGNLARLRRRCAELRRRRDELGAACEGAAAELAGLTVRLAVARVREAAAAAAAAARRRAAAAAAEARRQDEAARRELEARLALLRELEAQREGLGAGARCLLERYPRLVPVAERVMVDPEVARALERALGEDAGALLAPDEETWRAAAAWLGREEVGRAVVWQSGGEAAVKRPWLPEDPDVVGWAPDLLRWSGGGSAVAAVLLRDVVVVRHREAALRLRSATWAQGLCLVTLAGELFGPGPRIVAGDGRRGGALLGRRAEIEALRGAVAAAAERCGAAAAREEEARRALAAAAAAAAAAARQTAAAARECARATEELEGLRHQARTLAEEEELDAAEVRELTREAEARAAAAGEVAAAVTRAARRVEELQAAAAGLERTWRERRRDLARAGAARERAQAAWAAAGQAWESLRVMVARLEEGLRELERSRASLAAQERARAEEGRAAARQADAEEERAAAARKAAARWESLLGQARAAREEAAAELGELETRRRELRERAAALGRRREEGRVREGELRTRLESLLERLREETGQEVPPAPAGAPEDLEALEAEAARLKGKLERLGPVNAQALEGLRALEEREAFLRRQEEDLRRAKGSLEELIRRLDQRSRELFLATFARIRTEFRQLFRRLFGGGRADIRLLDEERLPESGVEILAQPPEKGTRSLDMLSGGEQVMTTIALLFAVFRARPCPFCLLDEVDAALDEANVERFLALVRGYLHQTQFIVVTHNKRTIAAADVIHGITMPRAGRSLRVSVKLENGRLRSAEGPAEATPWEHLLTPAAPDSGR